MFMKTLNLFRSGHKVADNVKGLCDVVALEALKIKLTTKAD